jgi:peptidoglycan hydrolase-like protein with peptidoglycan-binding domain
LDWAGALGKTSFWTGKVAAIDYGPCVAPGHLFSGHYTKPNPFACPAAPVRPLPTLQLKARGVSVALLQRALKVTSDGIFGPNTANAVLKWRKSHHLSTSKAVVDSSMWAGLTSSGQLN